MDLEEQKNKKPYRQLIVWHKAHDFVLKIYVETDRFPKHELYGLTSQLRRAAASVTTNLVEGYSKQSRKDLLRFLDIAKGSLTECEYLLELARDLHYLDEKAYQDLEELRSKTGFLLHRFIQSKR